ncbi:MAG: DUF1844 domain-containing protein [Verrucomicrobia bacterium]|nr:DUF1844 domain-containing protein [Verrucomicrobiota bacterium]
MAEKQTERAQDQAPPAGSSERESALFVQLVLQQANTALLFLGRIPDPQSGKPTVNLEAARLFIDTLETLDRKTRGNLTDAEQRLLKDQLTALRLAFVEEVNKQKAAAHAGKSQAESPGNPKKNPAEPGAEGRAAEQAPPNAPENKPNETDGSK